MTYPDITRQLSAKQRSAIALLVTGTSIIDVSKAIGVHRATLSEWLHSNPFFILEYNKAINELHKKTIQPYQDRMTELVDISLKTVSDCIRAGCSPTARWLLDRVSTFPSAITEKFQEIAQPKPKEPEDLDMIINTMVDEQIAQLIKEENLTDLDVISRPEFFAKVKQDLINDMKTKLQHERNKE